LVLEEQMRAKEFSRKLSCKSEFEEVRVWSLSRSWLSESEVHPEDHQKLKWRTWS